MADEYWEWTAIAGIAWNTEKQMYQIKVEWAKPAGWNGWSRRDKKNFKGKTTEFLKDDWVVGYNADYIFELMRAKGMLDEDGVDTNGLKVFDHLPAAEPSSPATSPSNASIGSTRSFFSLRSQRSTPTTPATNGSSVSLFHTSPRKAKRSSTDGDGDADADALFDSQYAPYGQTPPTPPTPPPQQQGSLRALRRWLVGNKPSMESRDASYYERFLDTIEASGCHPVTLQLAHDLALHQKTHARNFCDQHNLPTLFRVLNLLSSLPKSLLLQIGLKIEATVTTRTSREEVTFLASLLTEHSFVLLLESQKPDPGCALLLLTALHLRKLQQDNASPKEFTKAIEEFLPGEFKQIQNYENWEKRQTLFELLADLNTFEPLQTPPPVVKDGFQRGYQGFYFLLQNFLKFDDDELYGAKLCRFDDENGKFELLESAPEYADDEEEEQDRSSYVDFDFTATATTPERAQAAFDYD